MFEKEVVEYNIDGVLLTSTGQHGPVSLLDFVICHTLGVVAGVAVAGEGQMLSLQLRRKLSSCCHEKQLLSPRGQS